MKDYSIFSDWKELHGKQGIFSFNKHGAVWDVFQHQRGNEKGRFYIGSVDRRPDETNTELYELAISLVADAGD